MDTPRKGAPQISGTGCSQSQRRYATMLGSPAGSMLRFLLLALLHVQCQAFRYSDPSLLDSTVAHGMVSILVPLHR